MQKLVITEKDLTLDDVRFFLEKQSRVELSDTVIQQINTSRKIIEDVVRSGKTVYGVNTGFGKFADVRIEPDETAELQRRLVLSHAAGVGEPMPQDIVRLMMLLKIKNASQGYSGVRLEVVQLLVDLLNKNIVPVVPQKGSDAFEFMYDMGLIEDEQFSTMKSAIGLRNAMIHDS